MRTKAQVVYKVIRNITTEKGTSFFRSCFTGFFNGGIKYKVGEWTRQRNPNYPAALFVFHDEQSAQDFAATFPNRTLQIYKALAAGLNQDFAKFSLASSAYWPAGTYLAKSVKLLEEVPIKPPVACE